MSESSSKSFPPDSGSRSGPSNDRTESFVSDRETPAGPAPDRTESPRSPKRPTRPTRLGLEPVRGAEQLVAFLPKCRIRPGMGFGARGRNRGRWRAPFLKASLFGSLLIGLGLLGGPACRTSSEPENDVGVELQLDAVPLLLKADSIEVATIWATVLEEGHPVADSTVVHFAASLGSIEPEAYTRDGLARVEYGKQIEAGVSAIVAQVKGVRDTVLITIF